VRITFLLSFTRKNFFEILAGYGNSGFTKTQIIIVDLKPDKIFYENFVGQIENCLSD
jgi:hypothetical protein